jgi:hypothetical protein
MGVLSFSQTISLSLLNDKKKEEKKNERGCRQEGRNGREEEMEGRRRNKENSSVLGCRIVLCIFFSIYVRCQLMSGRQKTPPLRTDNIADISLGFS